MIELTKINGEKILINSAEIEFVETTFDTIISFRSGRKISVIETSKDISEKVIEYKRNIFQVK